MTCSGVLTCDRAKRNVRRMWAAQSRSPAAGGETGKKPASVLLHATAGSGASQVNDQVATVQAAFEMEYAGSGMAVSGHGKRFLGKGRIQLSSSASPNKWCFGSERSFPGCHL